jgi:hypothetical protein
LTRDYATAFGLLLFFLAGPGALSVDACFGRGRDIVTRTFASIMETPALMGRILLFGRMLLALPFLADAAKGLIHVEQEQALFAAHGLPRMAVYPVIAIGRLRRHAAGGLSAECCRSVWSAVQGFILHSPASREGTGLPTADLLSVFVASGGVLSSFCKDLAVIGGAFELSTDAFGIL